MKLRPIAPAITAGLAGLVLVMLAPTAATAAPASTCQSLLTAPLEFAAVASPDGALPTAFASPDSTSAKLGVLSAETSYPTSAAVSCDDAWYTAFAAVDLPTGRAYVAASAMVVESLPESATFDSGVVLGKGTPIFAKPSAFADREDAKAGSYHAHATPITGPSSLRYSGSWIAIVSSCETLGYVDAAAIPVYSPLAGTEKFGDCLTAHDEPPGAAAPVIAPETGATAAAQQPAGDSVGIASLVLAAIALLLGVYALWSRTRTARGTHLVQLVVAGLILFLAKALAPAGDWPVLALIVALGVAVVGLVGWAVFQMVQDARRSRTGASKVVEPVPVSDADRIRAEHLEQRAEREARRAAARVEEDLRE